MPQVLTANRLKPGEVVYWNGAKGWVGIAQAEVLPDDQAEDILKRAQEYVAKREVVGTYLFDVRTEKGQIVPVKMREAIRATGPTVRRDLGKQAG